MRMIFDTPHELDAGADDDGARYIAGTLVPYGRPGNTSAGRVTVRAGTIDLPMDPRRVKLTHEHDRRSPIGFLADLDDTDAGLSGRFRLGSSTLAAEAHTEAAEGVRDGLSIELDDVKIEGGELVAGRLVNVALVAVPAFDDARAMAAALRDNPVDDTPNPPPMHDPAPAPAPKPKRKTKGTAVTDEPTTEAPEAPDDTTTLDAARVPSGFRAARTEPRLLAGDTPESAMAAVAAAMSNPGDPALMAALSDVTYTGAGNAAAPQWLGKLWSGDRVRRPYVDSITRGRLSNGKALAWDWTAGNVPAGGDYSGDKTAIPSPTVASQAYTVDAIRWAGGHDLDRAIFDFNMTEYLTAYSEAMVDDYRKTTDNAAIAAAIVVGTATTPATTAAGLVDAAVKIAAAGGRADTVFIAADLVESLASTDANSLPAVFSNFSLDDWLDRIHPGVPAGKMLVQDRRATQFFELSDPPVRVDAMQLALGGVDRAFFGYYVTVDHNPNAIVVATPAAA